MNPGWKDLHYLIDVTATLVIPQRDPSFRWGDELDSEASDAQSERSAD
jgi:hypothetical protein